MKLQNQAFPFLFMLAGVLLLAVTGCKKNIDPEYDWTTAHSDTTFMSESIVTPQPKVILVEEFTGVYCYTCPLAHYIVNDLSANYPGRIAAMNIHSHYYGIYDEPAVMGNTYDFRTEDGDTIVNMLGGVLSVPSGSFDRVVHYGETAIISKERDEWEGYFNNRLGETVPANLEISNSYDEGTRELQLVVRLDFIQSFSESVYLSIALTEDHIIDKQYVDTAVVNNYSHEHILRKSITPPRGILLDTDSEPGRVVIRIFNESIPQEWNPANLKVVAFIHNRNSSWEVFQTSISPIIP